MKPSPRPAEKRGASPDSPSLDAHFENYFVVARNRTDGHGDVTIRREKTDRYLSLASRDYRYGNSERGVTPHDQVFVYAAIQLVWDPTRRRWALPPRWAERLFAARPDAPSVPVSRHRTNEN